MLPILGPFVAHLFFYFSNLLPTIMIQAAELIVAPVGAQNKFKEFCNQGCVDAYERKRQASNVGKGNMHPCAVCNTNSKVSWANSNSKVSLSYSTTRVAWMPTSADATLQMSAKATFIHVQYQYLFKGEFIEF